MLKCLLLVPLEFNNKFLKNSEMLSLSEAVIFFYNKKDNSIKIISKSRFSFLPTIDKLDLQQYHYDKDNNYHLIFHEDNNYIRSLIKINALPNTYILVGKVINDQMLRYINNINLEGDNYYKLKGDVEYIKSKFYLFFTLTIFLILFSIFLLTIYYSTKFFLPILDLISATRKVSEGNYSSLLATNNSTKEVLALLKSFNRMTKSIARKTNDINLSLHIANNEARFLKSIFGSLPFSVITVDLSLKIKLFNKSARGLLTSINNKENLQNSNISEFFLDINSFIDKLHISSSNYISDKVTIKLSNNQKQELSMLLSVKSSIKEIDGYIIILLPS